MTAPRPSPAPQRAGRLALVDLVDRLDRLATGRDRVTWQDMADELGAGGLAPLLTVVALLMILPLSMIPGVGGVLGLLAALIGLHMLVGRDRVSLPGVLGRCGLPADRLRSTLARLRPTAVRMNRRLRARYEPLAASRLSLSLIAVALIVAGLSLIVVGAIPVAAPLLGLPVAVFSLGVLFRDGIAVVSGWVLLGGAVAMIAAAGQTLAG